MRNAGGSSGTALADPGPGDVAVVQACGHVDRDAVEACDWMISRAQERTRRAVLDLSEAQSIDYRSAVVLVSRRRVLHAHGGELAVVAPLREVRHTLRAAAGGEVPVFPTMAEALSWVRGDGDYAVARPGRGRSAKR